MLDDKISVFGLGYVGLCTAVSFSKKGYFTIGVDIDIEKLNMIKQGNVPIYEPELDIYIIDCIKNKSLILMDDYDEAINNTNISFSTKYKNVNIGKFIDNQKQKYKGNLKNRRKLTENELQLLTQLNTFKDWLSNDKTFLNNNQKWMIKYNLCVEYEKTYNKNITQKAKYKDINIGYFIDKQKQRYKGNLNGKRKLEDNELQLLTQLNTFKDWLNKL